MNRIRLVTFDAFGTLYTPRQSIGKQYTEVAYHHGLNSLRHDEIEKSFRNGEPQLNLNSPNTERRP